MRQSNGSKLFHTNDARSTAVGLIEVDAEDSRSDILAALLTQEKLGRKQIALVMLDKNTAFRNSADFDHLQHTIQNIQTQVVFVTTQDTLLAKFARKQHYTLFLSLEKYAQYAQTFLSQEPPASPDQTQTAPPANKPAPPVPASLAPPTPPVNKPAPPAPISSPTPSVDKPDVAKQTVPIEPPFEPPLNRTEPTALPLSLPATPSISKTQASAQPEPPADAQSATIEQAPTLPLPPPEPKTSSRKKKKETVALTENEQQDTTTPGNNRPNVTVAPAAPLPILFPERDVPPPNRRVQQALVPVPEASASIAPITPSPVYRRSERRRRNRFIPFLLLLLLLLLIGGSILSIFLRVGPLIQFFPGNTATITITLDSKAIKQTYNISAVTTTPDATRGEVSAHFLHYTTPTQTATVNATGTGTTSAQQATGMFTFYNALPSRQTVPAGTVIVDVHGLKFVNDTDAVIEAATPPQEGFIEVSAHAVTAGEAGKIGALDFNAVACCLPGITVQNKDDFFGGADAQPYTYVQQSDIDNAANQMKATLLQSGQQALQAQILPGYQQMNAPQCTPRITADHQTLARVTALTVSESVECVTEIYDKKGAQTLAENLLKAAVTKKLGAKYIVSGDIITSVTGVKAANAGTITVPVQISGMWIYQLQDGWKEKFASLIAGKRIKEAIQLLAQQTDGKKVKIEQTGDLLGGTNDTVPTDHNRILFRTQVSPPQVINL